MGPGVPAILTLAGTIVVGLILQEVLGVYGRGGRLPDEASLRRVLLTQTVVGVTFWIWALRNCVVDENLDLGVVTFAAATFASASGWLQMDLSNRRYLRRQMVASGLSGTLVGLNYLLGFVLLIDKPWTFPLYMAIGCALWVGATAIVVRLLRSAMGVEHYGSGSPLAPSPS